MKKILFMSTAKLTTISIGLLLAVFCTIGMSFTPVEEEVVEIANDSTSISGPQKQLKKSHWTTSGNCGGTNYNNNKDYGKVVVTVVGGTGGTVSASGNNGTSSTSSNNTTSVTITWNCGYTDSSNHNDLTAKHTNKITFTANPITGYQIEGWYADAACTDLVSSETNYSEDFVIGHDSWGTSQSDQYESSGKAQTWNRYAKFVEIVPVDLTFIAPGVGGSYTVTTSGSSSTVSSSNVVKTGITTEVSLVATPASGYMFAGWYQMDGAGNVTDLGTTASYNKTFATSVSVGARFISTSTPKFKNITKDVEYYGLRQATLAASAGDKIIPVADCVVDGSDLVTGESYTIPAGVTLLIPYNSSNTVATTVPAKENYSGGSAPSPYRKLTLGEGVKIIVAGGGAISVASEFYGPATYSTAAEYKAGVRGPHGFIYMNSDSEIILNNGANLYAWGYITGDGEITAQNGSTVYEMMQMTDYRGGSATSDFTDGGVFPFSQYYIQNIESALHLESGATEYVRAAVTMSSKPYPATAKLIGASGALFNISSGVLTKKYDRLSDRLLITMNGNGSLASMALKFTGLPLIGSIDLNTGDYVLPINSNMRIEVASGKTLTLSQDLAVLPGVEVHISTGAKLLISSGYEMYAYDMAEWVGKGYVFPSLDIKPLNYVARNHVDVSGAPRSRSLANAKIIVDGGIEATGSFFTTESGADICSTLGSNGYIKLVSKAPTNTNTQQATQSGTDVTRKNIPVTSAQLHNEDGYYTTTSGAPANTTINYKHGHWGWRVIWKLEDGTELKRAYYYKQPDATWLSSNKPAETHPDAGTSSCTYTFNGWNQETISAQQEIEITADFTKTCPNYYEVIWKSEDGSATLETDASVGEGEATVFNGTAPAKATDWEIYQMYEFDGWTTESNGAGTFYPAGSTPAATADMTYYAHYAITDIVAKVTFAGGGEPTYCTTIEQAFNKAVELDNSTITILNDASGITTSLIYNRPNTTCTFDLNGKMVRGSAATLLEISAPGSIFTITDNNTEKNGRLENIYDTNAVLRGVYLAAGTLNVNAGTIYAENLSQYSYGTTATNKGDMRTRAIHMAATTKVNISGGKVHAVGSAYAYGVFEESSAANTTELNVTGGEVLGEAPRYAYGIYATGKVNISNQAVVSVLINDKTVNSNETYASSNFNDYTLHRYGYAIMMTATSNATQSSNYFGTLTITGGTINATNVNKTLNTKNEVQTEHTYGIYFNVSPTGAGAGKTAPDGTKVMKACAIGSIENATINLNHTGKTSYGIMAVGCYNSFDNKTTPLQVKNTTINVTGFQDAYGVYANAYVNWNSTLTNLTGNGGCTYGDIELTNCTINVTTDASGAYCGWVNCTSGTVAKAKDVTGSTSTGNADYYGEYAAAGKMTVHSGTYTATAGTSSAYGFGSSDRAKCVRNVNGVFANRDAAADPTGSLSTKETVAYPELYIHNGDISATTGTSTAVAVKSGGTTIIDGGTFNAYAGSSDAYCLRVNSGTTTVSNVTLPASATTKAYGVYVTGTVSNWSLFAYAGEVILNNCTVTATTRTSEDAKAVHVDGATKVYTQAQFDAMKTANNSDYKSYGDYAQVGERAVMGRATINGGTYTATAQTNKAYGIYMYSTKISTNKEAIESGNLEINNATVTATTKTGTTAYGVQPGGPALINGCTITATAGDPTRKSTASGVRAIDKTTTIKNSTITAIASDAAYGLEGYVEINATHGYCWHGEFDLSEAGITEVTAQATASGKKAYTIYLNSKKINIPSGTFAGDYATAANATINGGTYKAIGSSGYTISLGSQQTQGSVVAQPEVLVNGGFFNGSTAEVGTAGVVGHMQLKGGYFVHPTNLATYAVAPKSVWTLPNTHEHYDPYYYKITEHYNITFKNGSTELQTRDLEVGTIPTYTGTTTPTKASTAQYTYTFDGWSTTDGGDKLASLPAVSADATYFAHYATILQSYTATFNLQGHGDAITSQTKDYGSKVDKPTDPTADGWIFGGWFKEASCTNEWNFSTDYVQGTTELFAKWTMDGVGPKLDIVDWTSSALTINMNGIPAAGWNYTIKVGELESQTYAKDDRDDDRTLTVDYKDEIHIPNPDTQLRIVVTKGNTEVYSSHNYIIPHVYSSNNAKLDNVNTVDENGNSILVVNSGTLEIATSVKVNAIYVAPGAELKVDENVTLTVDSLMLRTTPWEAAILDNQGTISSSKTYYTRKIADNTKYYQFAIPLASDVKNVRLSNNSKCTYNTSWMLKSYNEESRAKNGAVNTVTVSNWKLLEPDGEGHATILGSVGYEMFSNTPYYREYYFPVKLPETETTEVGVSYHLDEAGEKHAGWNALCSPLMGRYSQTKSDPSERLKISELNPDGTYQQTAPDIINPAVPFYYQATHNGTISFKGNAMIFNAPRRAWNTYVPTQWMQLAISNLKGDKLDETSIYAHPEKFAPEYETGYDVAKQSLTGGKALIYSELPCGKLAFAAVPDSLAEQRVPLTIYAATQEEYVFSLAENNYLGRLQHVLLHDTQNGLVIDLLERDYSAKLNAGTNAGRFYIQCVFAAEAPAVTTSVNSVESNDDAPQKIMYKNKVYIIYQGRVYDMTGRQCELR